MNMDLRYGETLDRTWNAWQNQHPTPKTDADGGNIPGPDAPYHHDAHNDWKDYGQLQVLGAVRRGHPATSTPTKATYRRWSNGTYDLRPDFTQRGLPGSRVRHARQHLYAGRRRPDAGTASGGRQHAGLDRLQDQAAVRDHRRQHQRRLSPHDRQRRDQDLLLHQRLRLQQHGLGQHGRGHDSPEQPEPALERLRPVRVLDQGGSSRARPARPTPA